MTGGTDVRGLQLSLAVYVVVLGMKLGVYFMSGVLALLAEALHTLSDILISGFLLAAVVWSRRAADERHMLGYGRAQNAAALVAATLFLSFTSFQLYQEAIPRLFRPAAASHENLPLVAGVLVVSMLVAAAPLVTLLRQRSRGAAARAQLMELVNDQLGLAAALGIGLFRENLCVLLGQSPGPEFLARVEGVARSVPGVLGLHELRAEYIGPDTVHAGMHIEVARGLPVEEADRIAREVRERVERATGCRHCVVHADPVDAERRTTATPAPLAAHPA